MTREILGDILKRMANDGQSQENMGKVAAHYNAMTATIENNDDPNNEHKNTNGTWKTPEQIWGELQLGKKGGSQTTDATVEPQTVSGGSVSTSDDGSSESQEIQPDQVIEQGGYEYKFGVDADGMPVYYTKKKGGKNWTEVDPKEEDGKVTNPAYVSIGQEFGHFGEESFDRSGYFKAQKAKKDIQDKRDNPTTIEDMGLTREEDGSYIRNEHRFKFIDGEWWKQPIDGVPQAYAEQRGVRASQLGGSFEENLNNVLDTETKVELGIDVSEDDISQYLHPSPKFLNEAELQKIKKDNKWWRNGLNVDEQAKVIKLNEDDDFDWRNTKTWVNKNEATVREGIEKNFPGCNVEEYGVGNAIKITAPWRSEPYVVDLVPGGDAGLKKSTYDSRFNKERAVLNNFIRDYEKEGNNIDKSLAKQLGERQVMDSTKLSKEGIDGVNGVFKDAGLPYSVKQNFGSQWPFHESYTVSTPSGPMEFTDANEITNWFYENLSQDEYDEIQKVSLDKRTEGVKVKQDKINKVLANIPDEEVEKDWWTKGEGSKSMIFDLDQDSAFSEEAKVLIKKSLETPIKEEKMVANPHAREGQPPVVKGLVTVEGWEKKRYEQLLGEMKGKISDEEYSALEKYLNGKGAMTAERLLDQKNIIANRKGDLAYETFVGHDYNIDVRIGAADMVNKTSKQIIRERNDLDQGYMELTKTMKSDKIQLESRINNISLNMKRDGCGVQVYGEGDEQTVVVSHPDPEKQKRYQTRLEGLLDQSRTLRTAGENAWSTHKNKTEEWKEAHLDANLENEQLQHLVNKEYDSEKVVWQDLFDGFRSFGYNIPAAFGNDWAVEQAGNFNTAKQSFQTKLTMEEASEFGNWGFTAWRTFNQQAGNMVIATASSFVVPGGALLGISGATLATATAYGLSSAGGKRVDLLGRNERGDKAKGQLAELEKHYKDGNIGYEEYKKQAMALQSTISMGDLSSTQILLSSAWSGISEGGIMLVAGTAVNAMKFKGMMTGAFSSNAGDQMVRGIGGRILNGTIGTTGMITSELVEEFGALGADKLGDAYILGDEVWDGLSGEFKETFWSTLISSGPMSAMGNTYSNVISHVQNTDSRNQWFNEIKPEIGRIDAAINNLNANAPNYQSDLTFLQDAKIEQIRKVVKLSQEAEMDALALGPDAVQKIIVSNKNLKGLYSQAGITAGMSETEIEDTINKYTKGLDRSEKQDFNQKLKIAKESIAEQKGAIDYGDDKTAHTVEYNNDGSVKSEGVIHRLFGPEGVAMAEKLMNQDPAKTGYLRFDDLTAKEKAIAVHEALKEKRDTKEVNKLKKDTKMKESVEREVYTDKDGKGITKEEWKILNNKKRVPTDLKQQEDALYNTVGQYANARKGEALVLANEGMQSAASMLQDQSLAGLEINEANGLSDLKKKVYQAVNDGLITEEKADEIIQGINEGKVKAAILGNKYITTEVNATNAAVAQGNLLAGTAMSHEIGHFIDDTAMNDTERESYAGHLNEYMAENIPTVHQAAIDRNSKFKDDSRYDPELSFEEQTPAAKDEYTKSVQDELRQNKNKKHLNKVKKQSQTGFKNRMASVVGGNFNINNKNDAAAWMGSYLTGFEKGEVGELQKRKLKAAENDGDRTKEGYRTSSDLQDQLEQRSINEDGSPRTPTKADASKMALDMLTFTPTGELANGVLDSELANQVGGIVENITKKLYDPIAPDARNGVTRNQFKEAAVVKAWELLGKEYDPTGMKVDGYMSFLLNERSKDIAGDLGIESTVEYGGRGIDVKLEDAKNIESDLTAEDAFNEEAESITNPELPLTENIDVSKTDQQAILDQALIDVGVKLPAIDAEVSKNKFTTPFISTLKKAFGIKNGIIHQAILNTIGKNKAEVETFLTNPKNKLSILRSMPTSWLAVNIPSAVQKSVGGTRVNNGDGTTTFKPNWTSDWQGEKIDRWNAADVGPYRGNTSGPQVMKRNPSPSSTTNAEMLSSFAKGETMTDMRRNGLDKLAMAMAQEYGLETFKNDLNNDGPMSEIFRGRQDLFDRVLAENHVEEIGRQMQRGTVKFSEGETQSANNVLGDALNQELDNMLRDVIANVPEGGIKTNKQLDQLIAGHHPHLVNAFKATGIYDMFGETKGFIEIAKNMDFPPEFEWLEIEYIDTAHSNFKNQKESLNDLTNVLVDRLPGELLGKMGYRFFGLHNPRVLDGAKKKRKGPNKGKPGDYYATRKKIENKQGQKTLGLELDFDINGVELMNSDIGIMKDVQDILNLPITAEEKKVKLKKLQPRIDAANANNKKMLKYLVTEIALAVEADPSLGSGAMALYQSASQNVFGMRALTDLSMIKVMDGSQAPYLTKKGNPTMTNTGIINRAHPDFARAFEMANGDLSLVGKLLNNKGEHIDPSAPLQAKLAEKTLQLASKLKNVTNEDTRNLIILEHNNEMDLLLATFDQALGPFIDSKIQDNKLGTTSQLGYARNFTIPAQLKNYIDTKQGGAATSLINKQTTELIQRLSQQDRIDLKNIDKAKENARLSQGESQGMSAFDFDETLIDKGENTIIATKGDESITITSAEWPILGPKYIAQGYDLNFDDLINVKGGVEGPLMQKFRNRIKKYGIENNYILTARQMEAAPAIQAWLAQQGIDMPIENIVGLGDSTSEAKAQWMIDKFAEGYNDMYFVDDALPNVEAVQNVIDQLDIKGKAAQVRLSADPSSQFNGILEDVFGIGKEKVFSEAKAKQRGENKGKFRPWIPPSAEDFKGLLYNFLGKGKAGESHFQFLKENLLDPFSKAQRKVDKAQQALSSDYRAVKKAHKPVVKNLNKNLPGTEFTYDQGVRVLLWDRAGYDIPGLTVTDKNKILSAIKKEPSVIAYANDLSIVSKQDNGYSKPGEFWLTESVGSDLHNMVQKIGRDQFLEPFKENRRKIFGEWQGKKLVGPNMNKIESIFGVRFREALTDMLWRMENGTNRTFGENRLVNSFANWVNNSVGAIMFFNMRSAVLQTLSTVNFINFGDNNVFKAAKAFANQKQFWSDFSMLFNSDMLKQRRSGLKTDINQNEIAEVAKKSKGNPKAILQHLLRLGFLPTQAADSFAIAMGGATFFRNRFNALVKQGLSIEDAKKQAFIDFQEIAEETQQSARPDLISQQQASSLGRLILAFQNTPMQYARLTKKAALDLINRRGSDKQNISRILYYGAVQNMIFSSLQQAMFKHMFDEEEDEEKKRTSEMRVANSMLDSFLRGTGVYGAIAATLKNMVMKFIHEDKKKGNMDVGRVLVEGLNLSPPVGSKARKLYSGLTTYKFKKEEMYEMDKLDTSNPMYQTIGNTVSALTNIPLDRVVNKTNNIKEAMNQNNEAWQRIGLMLGWNKWDLGVESQAVKESSERVKKAKDIERKKKSDAKKEVKRKEKEKERKEQAAREVQCSARIRKGKGPRCKNRTENKSGKCYAHQ